MDREIFEDAQQIIKKRRQNAICENQRRINEINSRIPEIREINDTLYRTGRELIRIITESGENDPQARIEQLRRNNLDAQMVSRQLLAAHGYSEDYLDIPFTCKKCNDTGYSDTGWCDCLTALCGKLSADRLNRTTQLELSSFDTFSLSYYQGEDYTVMSNILTYCRSYAERFTRHSESLLMFGGTGLGKTHLSLAIADRVLNRGFSVVYDSTVNILRNIEREHFSREHLTDTIDLVMDTDLLILDDLGTEFDSQFSASTVYNIINTRLNRGIATIISTNMVYDAIVERYGNRVVSRLTSVYTCFEFRGKDIRMQKQREKTRNR